MGVNYFDEWVEKDRLAKHGPLELLKGSVIGIDAASFAKKFLTEPLLTALGGSPIALDALTNTLKQLRASGLELHFVFNGLSFRRPADPFSLSQWTSAKNAQAFTAYEEESTERAGLTFQELGALFFCESLDSPKLTHLDMTVKSNLDDHMDVIKAKLHELNIPFTVAPYSALAQEFLQLAYFERHPNRYVDVICGPTELFYFGVEKIVTDLGLGIEEHLTDTASIDTQKTNFRWIESAQCMRALGGSIHPQVFAEALILTGSDDFLPTYPPLVHKAVPPYSPGNIVRDAVQVVVTTRGDLALPLESISKSERDQWLNGYKQILTIIKHHVIITSTGDIECLEKDTAPIDVHECIGLRLPEELYMYLTRGAIGTRILNYLTRDEILIPSPLAGADSSRFQDFVSNKLEPLRRECICLLTESLHRYYQRTEIRQHLWFDRKLEAKFKPIDITPSPRRLVSDWFVRAETLGLPTSGSPSVSLSFTILRLQDEDFAKRTVAPRTQNASPLLTRDEIVANTIFRFLQLRNFVDQSHRLTAWGKVLCEAMSNVQGSSQLEEAVFLAIELLRFEVLDAAPMGSDDKGSPRSGNALDKKCSTLVSRVACTGQLRHKSIGYSGPLIRSLLAYHSFVSTLWWSLRDLLEMNMTAGFLDGSFSRERDDWIDLSLRLPFRNLSSCSLGIATWTYLDQLQHHGDPTSTFTRRQTKERAQQWIKFSDFDSSLLDSFRLWDAIYGGVKAAGALIPDRKLWDESDGWLAHRR